MTITASHITASHITASHITASHITASHNCVMLLIGKAIQHSVDVKKKHVQTFQLNYNIIRIRVRVCFRIKKIRELYRTNDGN